MRGICVGIPPVAKPPDGFRQVFLMQQGGSEPQEKEVQVEQGADAYGGEYGADAHLTAQPPADEHNNHLNGGAADAHRPAGFAGQHHHQCVPRAGAKGAFHIQPCAEGQQLHAGQQRGQTAPKAL